MEYSETPSANPIRLTPRDIQDAPPDLLDTAHQWAEKIKSNLLLVSEAGDPEEAITNNALHIDESINDAPRRRSADPGRTGLANMIAQLLYPSPNDSLAPLIRYEENIVLLRKLVLRQRQHEIEDATTRNSSDSWEVRIRKQGPWNQAADPLPLCGAPAVPMPVKISDHDSLEPFFEHLRVGGTQSRTSSARAMKDAAEIDEPGYYTQTLEFQKGVLYADGRMDLCKMVLGPPNIENLVTSLKSNTFIKHFLLGNNLIGPHGAKCIADFLEEFPNRMDTWYLAGNCIDGASFKLLVDQWIQSSAVTNIWLKRNPLGPSAAQDVFRLITQTPNLRTLDLDQTLLGDVGVTELFSALASHVPEKPLAFRNLYLNASGIGEKAASAIGEYLASPHCTITSLYLTNNPLGSNGTVLLASGLRMNKSLLRLTLASVGMDSHGAIALCDNLLSHPTLSMLDIGQSYATEDLSMRYNWIADSAVPSIKNMAESIRNLKYFNLGYCALSNAGINTLLQSVLSNSSILYFEAKTIHAQERDVSSIKAGQEHRRLMKLVQKQLAENVKEHYKEEMNYNTFNNGEKRWLVNDKEDVRKIDSVYRNRDANMARRGLKKLDKWWEDDDGTLNEVMASGPSCSYRKRITA